MKEENRKRLESFLGFVDAFAEAFEELVAKKPEPGNAAEVAAITDDGLTQNGGPLTDEEREDAQAALFDERDSFNPEKYPFVLGYKPGTLDATFPRFWEGLPFRVWLENMRRNAESNSRLTLQDTELRVILNDFGVALGYIRSLWFARRSLQRTNKQLTTSLKEARDEQEAAERVAQDLTKALEKAETQARSAMNHAQELKKANELWRQENETSVIRQKVLMTELRAVQRKLDEKFEYPAFVGDRLTDPTFGIRHKMAVAINATLDEDILIRASNLQPKGAYLMQHQNTGRHYIALMNFRWEPENCLALLYQSQDDGTYWARPAHTVHADVAQADGKMCPRFLQQAHVTGGIQLKAKVKP
jgi:cell division protein FtsB